MKLVGSWVNDPSTKAVFNALERAGHAGYFVGGCVRNELLGAPVGDIDIATTARPDQTITAANSAGLKSIPTGLDHGTVTIVVDGKPHEVTTFREDVATDGRRAVVAYSDDIAEDAQRRDFTINALYADRHGNLIDPLNGLEDLRSRKVRFIGDAQARIREDYLRILRFFRFYAWYSDPAKGPDADGLAACAANLAGLDSLSNERVGAEFKKLLAAPDPAPAVAVMAHSGILGRILPGADHDALAPLIHLEIEQFDPVIRLAALGGEDAAWRLRLSKQEAKLLEKTRSAALEDMPPSVVAYRLGAQVALGSATLRAALLGQELPQNLQSEIDRGAAAVFPVRAADLPEFSGPALGEQLRRLEERWIDSAFRASKSQLLNS